jgi:hypothetical protein
MSRLQPGITVPFPDRDDELRILSYNLPFADETILDMCLNYLQLAHRLDLPYSVRDGLNAMRYTLKLRESDKSVETAKLFQNAVRQILGEEALDLEKLAARRRKSGEQLPRMNLGDYFFGDDPGLNPDAPDASEDAPEDAPEDADR